MSNETNNKIVMFSTPDCGACRMLYPMIKGKELPIEIVDATEQTERAAKHEVSSVPKFVLEDENGEHVETLATGAQEAMKYLSKTFM